MITIQTFYIDGSFSEFTIHEDIVQQLVFLKNQGYQGKELIHCLLTNDFSARPTSVNISGKLKNGTAIKETIYY
jgi:hypothetical protein